MGNVINFITGTESFKNILEVQGWNVEEYKEDSIFDVQWTSPAGGDFHLDIDAETPFSDFMSQAEHFNVDEYVMIWIENKGTRGVPATIRGLLEDAEAIQKELLRVKDILVEY